MSDRPMPGEIYKHFKGNIYRIVTLARHSESGEELVVYQALYGDFQVYARPLSMFLEPVDKNKYPDAAQKYRFEKQQELIQAPVNAGGMTEGVQPAPADSKMQHGQESPAAQNLQEKPIVQDTQDVQETAEETIEIDPLVLEFLDAGTHEERLNILAALHHRITDQMITTMALAVDLEIEDGDVEKRYEELKRCLLTYEKYECNRLR